MNLLDRAGCCPWCDGSEVWVWTDGVPGKFSIGCSNPNCGATGPFRSTGDEAVIAWNAAPRRRALADRLIDEAYDREALDRELSGERGP